MSVERHDHKCHAHGCETIIAPKLFMCPKHWHSLPRPIQAEIWAAYTPGQESTKTPSLRYLAVQQYAIARVASGTADQESRANAVEHLQSAFRWREESIAAGEGDPIGTLILREESSAMLMMLLLASSPTWTGPRKQIASSISKGDA